MCRCLLSYRSDLGIPSRNGYSVSGGDRLRDLCESFHSKYSKNDLVNGKPFLRTCLASGHQLSCLQGVDIERRIYVLMINLLSALRRQKDNIESSDHQRCHQPLHQHGNLRSKRDERTSFRLLHLSYLPILMPNDLRVTGLRRSSLAPSKSNERQAMVSVGLSGKKISSAALTFRVNSESNYM